MDVNRLFIHTLADLVERERATDEYTVLMSAALLRKLLVDGTRLVDQVNAEHKLTLSFRIGEVSDYEKFIHEHKPQFWAIGDGLDPDSKMVSAVEVSLAKFLARRVMSIRGEWVTVGGVIDYLANVDGAVHKTTKKSERQRVVSAASAFFNVNGLSGAVSHVKIIAKIAARGLLPLRNAVIAAGDASWASVDRAGIVRLRGDCESHEVNL